MVETIIILLTTQKCACRRRKVLRMIFSHLRTIVCLARQWKIFGMEESCKVFAKNNLRVTIEGNKKVVNFLDATLDQREVQALLEANIHPALCSQ